jgi:hypothetical protein
VPTYNTHNKTNSSNYWGISLLSITYKIVSKVLLSRLTPYTEEITGDHQCGFWLNSSTSDKTIFIRQILEKKSVYNATAHQIYIDFNKAYDLVTRGIYNIVIEFGIPMKVVTVIKMCLNEIYSKVWIGKYLSDAFLIHNGLKQGDALSPLLFNFPSAYAIRKIQGNKEGLERDISASGLCWWCYLGENINIIKKNTKLY